MVADSRSRKIAILAHCLLNQNAKVAGLAGYPGIFEPVVALLCRHGVGIIQMRCPEIAYLGPGRPLGTDTREQYESPAYRQVCRAIAKEVVAQVSAYRDAGYSVFCVLGVEGSPSCSVSRVPRLVEANQRELVSGKGIFMEVLSSELEKARFEVPMVGIPENDVAGNLHHTLSLLKRIISDRGD